MRKTQFGSYADKTTQSDTSVDFEKEVKAKSLETIEGDVEMNGNKVINMAEPVADSDGATKFYVDANAGGGAPLYIDTELTSAQLLDLHNTPVTLIPEPTDGSFYFLSKILIKYNFNTTAYSQVGSVNVQLWVAEYNGEVRGDTIFNPTFDSTLDYQIMSTVISKEAIEPFSVRLHNPSVITLGDGTMKVRAYYSVIETNF